MVCVSNNLPGDGNAACLKTMVESGKHLDCHLYLSAKWVLREVIKCSLGTGYIEWN